VSPMVSLACTLSWTPPKSTSLQSANSTLFGCFEAEVSSVGFDADFADIIAEHYQWIKKDLESRLASVPAHMDITFNFHVTQYSPIEGTLLEKVATLTRTAGAITLDSSSSEGYSSASPAESINEKERDSDDKFRADEGREGFVHWHQGRANLVNVVKQAVDQAHGPVSVNGEPHRPLPASYADNL
jgi:hypothetical protein